MITENFASEITFNPIPRNDCKEFIQTHYLGSFPAVSTDYIGVFYNKTLVGVLIYGRPSAPNIEKSIFNDETNVPTQDVIELQRLFLTGDEQLLPRDVRKNLAGYSLVKCNDVMRNKYSNVKVVVSYTDPDHHLGTVYKGTNGIFQGRCATGRMFKRPDGKLIRVSRTKRDAEGKISEPGEIIKISGKDRYVYPIGSPSQKKWVTAHLRNTNSKITKDINEGFSILHNLFSDLFRHL